MAFSKNKKSEKSDPPVATIRIGLQTANIWENATDGKTFYNVTFDRRYRDDSGNWHSSKSYSLRDLLVLAKLADMAHTKILAETSDDDSDATDEHEE